MASRKQDSHQANHREMSHCSKKILVLRNELRETENIGATDLDELIANFLLQVREFLFLICVKKLYIRENSHLTCNKQLTS